MRRLPTLILAITLGGLFSLGACSDKKKGTDESTEAKAAACESNADCAQGEVCLANACANAAPGAIYADPQSAVTAEKAKAHMEMINKAAEERVEKALEGAGAD
jgi:hypothetical protein